MALSDCQLLTTLAPAVPALIALVGVVVGALLGARLSFRNQYRFAVLQDRQRTYAALMGKKFLVTQLYVSRFEALAYSDYHERLWHLAGAPKDSLDLEEAKRWMRKSEDFAIDIAKVNQSLFESVGAARASYPSTSELEGLAERVYHFRTPALATPPQGADRAALDNWKQQVIPSLQRVVDEEYAQPINALLDCMKRHIADPVRL